MVRVRTRILDKPKHKQVTVQYERAVRSLIGQAGNLVRNTAVNSINQGAKSGVIYEKYNPRRTHKASAAGEPPATDTGYLVGNINIVEDADGLGVSVESRAEYSQALEFGTSKMGARPFLQPALEENKSKIKRIAQRIVKAK
mgnify:FL=1